METWKIAALAAMVLLAAYGVSVKQFFNEKHDWRAFIPLILLMSIALTVYYLYSGAYASISSSSYIFAGIVGLIFCLSTIASVIALQEGQVSVVIPVFSLNLVLVVIAGAVLLKEPMTTYKIAGVLLGAISIFLLVFESK